MVRAVAQPFRQRLSMRAFISLFLHNNNEIKANCNARFARYLRYTDEIFTRPSTVPTWKAYMRYHPPMFGLLQSKYDHVEEEIKRLREIHATDQILFVGGDGLTIMRVNWLIHRDPTAYLDETPMLVPIQGESPHGVFHVLHAGWRLYLRFLRACALHLSNQDPKAGINQQVRDDPTVSDLNRSLHFLNRVARAGAEYLVYISRTGGPAIDDVEYWLNSCTRNIDLAWLVHFLYDYAFMVLDFKNAVRANKSKHIDLIWREFLSLGRANTANKTQYCPMAIMRIFWSYTMHPHLKELYENMRSIPMSLNAGSRVGWDMPCEWLNLAITKGVKTHVSEDHITKFIAGFALSDRNNQLLRDQFLDKRSAKLYKMKSIEEDSVKLKTFFMQKIGSDWNTASRRNSESRLGITRGKLPWEEVSDAARRGGKDSVPNFVSETVRRYTNSFYRFSD